MAKTRALAAQPVAFSDVSTGTQWFISMSAIQFEDGVPKVIVSELPATLRAKQLKIEARLKELADVGVLLKRTEQPAEPAMKVEANSSGAAGNKVSVEVSNVRPDPGDPARIIFDVEVTETNNYDGLTVATVESTLGTAAGTGLVYAEANSAVALPKAGEYTLVAGANAAARASLEVPKTDSTPRSFKVLSRGTGPDGVSTTITISSVDAAAGTFAMTVVWSKAVPNLDTAGVAAAFSYAVAITAPDGGALKAPAKGIYNLTGGNDAQTATKASTLIKAAR